MNNERVSIKSASAMMENSGVFKPERKQNWSEQKSVPNHILVARAEREAKATRREAAESLRERFNARNEAKSAPLGIIGKTVAGGIQVIGFGVTVKTQDELFTMAKENGRQFVMVDGVKIG